MFGVWGAFQDNGRCYAIAEPVRQQRAALHGGRLARDERMVAAKDRELKLVRRFSAKPEQVFRAFADPRRLVRWWGPKGITIPVCEMDVRPGGRWLTVMRAPDGSDMTVSGVYREVSPDQKLVFTWAWRSTPERESLVTVHLKADGDHTIMTFTHEQFFDQEARDRHEHGWTGSFVKLEAHLQHKSG